MQACGADLPPEKYTDYAKVQAEIKRGDRALDRQNYDELRSVLLTLFGLAKDTEAVETKIKGTGLG